MPNNKRVEVALTYIHGIGQSSSRRILSDTGVSPDIRMHELSDEDLNKVRRAIEADYKVEGALRTEVSMNIKRLMDIGSYRGVRHRKGLPVRGQRTHTNVRTRKGPRRTVAGKKKAPRK